MMALTDFHCHILPNIDDGSSSLEESLALLRMEAEQGISRVVATPHFYPKYDSPVAFLDRRDCAESMLRKKIEDLKGFPKLHIGAEVRFFHGISESDYLPLLTIRETDSILIEMPPYPWSDTMYRELSDIWYKRGIRPIIAHVERYISPLTANRIFRHLLDLPVLIQANADFFIEKSTAGSAMKMLRSGRIHLIGSDCHGIESRKPNMSSAIFAIGRKLGMDFVSQIQYYEDMVLNK